MTFVFSVEKWSKYWNLALNSVRLSALQLQPTTLDEDALPHATQKNNVFTKPNQTEHFRFKTCVSGVCAVAANLFEVLGRRSCLFKSLTEILIYRTFILYFSNACGSFYRD